jgi:hypothetical protein
MARPAATTGQPPTTADLAGPVRHRVQHPPTPPLTGRPHPAAAYQARPKATPSGTTEAHCRIRHDTVDATGVVTLRHAGRLHHIGIGRTHARTRILMLINDLHIRITHATTGALIRELVLDPSRDYQTLKIKQAEPVGSACR